jgi:uncharacterized membrane protein YczE
MGKHRNKTKLVKQIVGVSIGVLFMGFGLSWLIPCGFGTDCFTTMNLAISAKLGWSLGTWQALLNCVLFIPVLLFGRRHIGFGTLANMLLCGYICDFFTWVRGLFLPGDWFEPLWVRVAVAVPALMVFVIAAAIYMDMGLGMAPYDALPFILHKVIDRFSFRTVRITFDLVTIAVGYVFGAPFAAVTLAMAFLLGPAVEAVGKWIEPILNHGFEGKEENI